MSVPPHMTRSNSAQLRYAAQQAGLAVDPPQGQPRAEPLGLEPVEPLQEPRQSSMNPLSPARGEHSPAGDHSALGRNQAAFVPAHNHASADLAALNARIEELEAANAVLRSRSRSRSHHTRFAEADYSSDEDQGTPDIRINKPSDFTGSDPMAVGTFLTQCGMYINLQPRKYRFGTQKVLFAASHLRDAAARWWTAEYSKSQAKREPWITDFDKFGAELRRIFGRQDAQTQAQRMLSTLKQTGSASDYYTKLLTYRAEAGWNSAAEVYAFHNGLKDKVKDALALRDSQPNNLADLAAVAIRIDQQLYDRSKQQTNQERRKGGNDNSKGRPRPATQDNPRPSDSSNSPRSARTRYDPSRQNTFRSATGTITREERDNRFKKGLCTFCAALGHTYRDCSKRPKDNQRTTTVNAVSTSNTTGSSSEQSKDSASRN